MTKERLILGTPTINRIATSQGVNPDEIRKQVLELQEDGIEKSEIFRQLMSCCGRPSTHCSGKSDGEVKDNGKYGARYHDHKHRH